MPQAPAAKMLVKEQFFSFASKEEPFRLRCGKNLNEVQVCYESYGELNAEKVMPFLFAMPLRAQHM